MKCPNCGGKLEFSIQEDCEPQVKCNCGFYINVDAFISNLQNTIHKMKNCDNCDNRKIDKQGIFCIHSYTCLVDRVYDKWQLKKGK